MYWNRPQSTEYRSEKCRPKLGGCKLLVVIVHRVQSIVLKSVGRSLEVVNYLLESSTDGGTGYCSEKKSAES